MSQKLDETALREAVAKLAAWAGQPLPNTVGSSLSFAESLQRLAGRTNVRDRCHGSAGPI